MAPLEKPRLEPDGLIVEGSQHWEMFETKVHIKKGYYEYKYKVKSGETRTCLNYRIKASINIPVDIIRHLSLRDKDRVQIAVKKPRVQ